MDAGNMLKPMLARGELRMVGATTLDEYRERIEKDPALSGASSRFRRRAERRGDDRDPARAQEKYEAHHQGRHRGRGAGCRGDAVRPLHHRALPARQGHRPRRRVRLAAAHGDRLQPEEIDKLQRQVDRMKMEEMAPPRRPTRFGRTVGETARRPRGSRGGTARSAFPVGPGEGQPRPHRRPEDPHR